MTLCILRRTAVPNGPAVNGVDNPSRGETYGASTKDREGHDSLCGYRLMQKLAEPMVRAAVSGLLQLAELLDFKGVANGECVTDFRWS